MKKYNSLDLPWLPGDGPLDCCHWCPDDTGGHYCCPPCYMLYPPYNPYYPYYPPYSFYKKAGYGQYIHHIYNPYTFCKIGYNRC